jgi:hypothetical protein
MAKPKPKSVGLKPSPPKKPPTDHLYLVSFIGPDGAELPPQSIVSRGYRIQGGALTFWDDHHRPRIWAPHRWAYIEEAGD